MSRRTLHRQMLASGLGAPSAWLLALRLDVAQRLLRERHCTTVGEAAAAVGLSRPYFSRAHVARFGVTPGQERRRDTGPGPSV